MREWKSHHYGNIDCHVGRMYDCGRTGYRRDRDADGLRKRGAEGLYRLHRLEDQAGITGLFLQLASLVLAASLLVGCTSAGSPPLEERNDELVCARHEAKVCPSAAGSASRLRKDEGACYCTSRERLEN
jgi:hypothetical protein